MTTHDPFARMPQVPELTVSLPGLAPSGALRPENYSAVFGVPGGKDVSPHVLWSGAPAHAKSFVVTVHDPDAPTGSGIWHWAVANIPGDITELAEGAGAEGALPLGAVPVLNDARLPVYIGAAPPPGHGTHHYFVVVSALDVERIEFPPDVTPATLGLIMIANVVARGYAVAVGEVPSN